MQIQLSCPVLPDTAFSYEAGQTRYTEQLSFCLLHNLSNLVAGGVSVSAVSGDDAAAEAALFSGVFGQWATFLDGVLPASVSDVPALPSPSDVVIYSGGGWQALLLQVLARIAGQVISHYFENWLNGGGGSDEGVVEKLEELRQTLVSTTDLLSSFRLSMDLTGSEKSASVGLTGVLEQEV